MGSQLSWLAKLAREEREADDGQPIYIECTCQRCREFENLSPQQAIAWYRRHQKCNPQILRRNASG